MYKQEKTQVAKQEVAVAEIEMKSARLPSFLFSFPLTFFFGCCGRQHLF